MVEQQFNEDQEQTKGEESPDFDPVEHERKMFHDIGEEVDMGDSRQDEEKEE